MHLEPSEALKGLRIIHDNVDPSTIAEDFLAHEFIKMFPEGDSDFYDKIRYYVRQYKKHHGEDRFWRLLAAMSETYMFKSYFRMLQGNQYKWIYAEVPLEKVSTPMLIQENTSIGNLMKKNNSNPLKVGEELRKVPWEDRSKIIHPFDFRRDNYPIVMEADGDKLIVLDGSRRTVNAAIYDMGFLEAYVGVKTGQGKPALREDFVADLFKVLKETEKLDATFMYSFINIIKEYKNNYINGPQLIDNYIRGAALPLLESKEKIDDKEEQIAMLNEVLEGVWPGDEEEKNKKNGKRKNLSKNTILSD